MKMFPPKDPSALLDYVWDWRDWLENDFITEYTFAYPNDMTLVSSINDQGRIIAWFSGGTLDLARVVTCHVTTNGGRIDERSGIIPIEDL